MSEEVHCGTRNRLGDGSEYDPGLTTDSIFHVSFFLYEIIDMPGGQINDPLVEETLFSSVPPSNSLVSVSDP